MFSKNKSSTKNKSGNSAQGVSIPSIISADLTVTGNLFSEGEIQIDGTINGDVKTATLLVGETATINGDITAKRVRVHGHINGSIEAQFVTLAQSAHVKGDVIHEDLAIEKGAFLEGHCKRISGKRLETAKVTPEKPPHLAVKDKSHHRPDPVSTTGGVTTNTATA